MCEPQAYLLYILLLFDLCGFLKGFKNTSPPARTPPFEAYRVNVEKTITSPIPTAPSCCLMLPTFIVLQIK